MWSPGRVGLVELARFQSLVQADIARMYLEAEGLDVVMFDEGMAHVGLGPLIPVRLMVLQSEYEEAARILVDEGLL